MQIFLLTFTLLNLSTMLIWNAELVREVIFFIYVMDKLKKPTKLQVECLNLKQYDVTETLRLILAVRLELTHDLEYWFDRNGSEEPKPLGIFGFKFCMLSSKLILDKIFNQKSKLKIYKFSTQAVLDNVNRNYPWVNEINAYNCCSLL